MNAPHAGPGLCHGNVVLFLPENKAPLLSELVLKIWYVIYYSIPVLVLQLQSYLEWLWAV